MHGVIDLFSGGFSVALFRVFSSSKLKLQGKKP